MSKTTKYQPRPYFNPAVLDEMDNEDAAGKNPQNDSTDSTDREGQSDTREGVDISATSIDDESTYKKRWIDLKKHYDSEVSTLRRELREAQEQKGSTNPPFTPPKNPEDLEKFRKQYPEFYDVMLSVAHQQANGLVENSSTRIHELEAKLAESEREKALKIIEKAHPDYVAVASAPEFLSWLEEQTSAVQSWVRDNSTDHQSFIRALDLYKYDKGLATSRSEATANTANTFDTIASAAMEVSTKNGGVTVGDSNKRYWSREEIERMHPNEYAKYEAEIDEAWREGRVR